MADGELEGTLRLLSGSMGERVNRFCGIASGVLLSILIASSARAAAITYSTVDLTPAGAFGARGAAASGTQQGGDAAPGTPNRAFLWNSTATAFTNLHPAGYTNDSQANSSITGLSATRQVGYVASDFNFGTSNRHAYTWAGTAASAIDLNPAGSTSSTASAIGGTQIVGRVKGSVTSNAIHAALWTGTSSTFVDLNPTSIIDSQANAVANGIQVGSGMAGNIHAYLWAGTAASAVDLNPAGSTQSRAYATTGTEQGGSGLTITGPTHAIYWTGTTADSAVDLNPLGFSSSEIYGMAPGIEVGYGFSDAAVKNHALAWFGNTASVIDLHQFLPAGYTSSIAYGVTSQGYIVGTASNNNQTDAFLWVPVPEPTSLGVMFLASGALLARRRRLLL
jgi:hypothetical protein